MRPALDDLRPAVKPVEEIRRVEFRELLHGGIDAAGRRPRQRQPPALQSIMCSNQVFDHPPTET